MANIDDVYGVAGNYLSTKDVAEGQILSCRIKSVEPQEFKDKNGNVSKKLVANLESGKPFAINKTNARRMAELFGTPDYTKWSGHSFRLVRAFTTFSGQEVDCLRVQKIME